MDEPNSQSIETTETHIRIVGINTDKTRRTNGSDVRYEVYFELSGVPSPAWRNIFEREWRALNPGEPQLWQDASIDRGYLVLHCSLLEIATTYLPVLKHALVVTNESYERYVREQASEQKQRENLWKLERKTVEDVAKSLRFD